jgi:cation transport protein ChaC
MNKTYPQVPKTDPPMDPHNVWVFGYGSLMWRPGFAFLESRPARLDGFSRDMCLVSIHYRGTREKPGMVCGLRPGGECRGRAFRIAPDQAAQVIGYLDDRELISYIYVPRHVTVELDDGQHVVARAYIADASHEQFAGHWADDVKAGHIAQGQGSEGRSIDYLANIVEQLHALNIVDLNLESLLSKARARA